MNESQTEFELIEPKLKKSGWGIVEGSKIHKQFPINLGRIQPGNLRASPLKADYVLSYKGRKLAVIEAKSDEQEPTEGVAQAKDYALKLNLETTFATNGKEIYQICMETGREEFIKKYPTPQELWDKTFKIQNDWKDRFNAIPKGGI